MGFIALGEWNSAGAKDREGGRGGHRKTAVSAMDPTRAFDGCGGQYTRFTQQFETNAGAHHINDGVYGAHFMEMNLVRRDAMDFAFGNGNALEHGDRFLLNPVGESARNNEMFNIRKGPAMVMFVRVMGLGMGVGMGWRRLMGVLEFMVPMLREVWVSVMGASGGGLCVRCMRPLIVVMTCVDIKLHTGDARFLTTRDVQVIILEIEFLQLALQLVGVQAKIEQCAQEHIAAESAENIEV